MGEMKPVCPKCGEKANCFWREGNVLFKHWHIYILLCPNCGHKEVIDVYVEISSSDLFTTCPFCNNRSDFHPEWSAELDEQNKTEPKFAIVCKKCGWRGNNYFLFCPWCGLIQPNDRIPKTAKPELAQSPAETKS